MSYSHEFIYDINASKTITNVTKDILAEIQQKAFYMTSIFDWIRFSMGFTTIFVVLKAIKYRCVSLERIISSFVQQN